MKKSPNWKNGHFVNTLKKKPIPFFKILGQWFKGVEHTVPSEPIPIIPKTKDDFKQQPESGLRITWLGHSTLLIEMDGKKFLIDPVWSNRSSPFQWVGPKRFHEPPLALEDLPDIDAVLISHDHYDHLDHRTIKALRDRVLNFVVPLGVGAHLEYWGVAKDKIIERDWWETYDIQDFSLIATPARHFSGRSIMMLNQDKTLWSGWVIKGPEHSIYYSGDTAMFLEFKVIGHRYGPFDVTFLETGAYNQLWTDVHLGPEQAIEARIALGSGLFVPVHWGTFNLALHAWTEPVERILVAAKQANIPVMVPKPGESFEPDLKPHFTPWWPEIPWQSVHETPIVSSGLAQ